MNKSFTYMQSLKNKKISPFNEILNIGGDQNKIGHQLLHE